MAYLKQLLHFSPLVLLISVSDARIGQVTRRTEETVIRICAADCDDAVAMFEATDPCWEVDPHDAANGSIDCYGACNEDNCRKFKRSCIDPAMCYPDNVNAADAAGVNEEEDAVQYDIDEEDEKSEVSRVDDTKDDEGNVTPRTICAADCDEAIVTFEVSDPCWEFDPDEVAHGSVDCYSECIEDDCRVYGGSCIDPVMCYPDNANAADAAGINEEEEDGEEEGDGVEEEDGAVESIDGVPEKISTIHLFAENIEGLTDEIEVGDEGLFN